MAKIRIPTPLQGLTGNRSEIEAEGATIEQVLEGLEKQCPGIRSRLCEADGKIRRFLNLYVNETDIRTLQGLDTPVAPKDEVSIVPAIAGGKGITLAIGTRKGAFFLRDGKLSEPLFLGNEIHHVVGRGKTLLMAARSGHLGPTLYRSADGGRTWKESRKPPAFPKRKGGRSVHHTFWLSPGPGRMWYAGTSPPGLFRSKDDGATWEEVKGFNDHPKRPLWCGDGQQSPPGGSTLHSIQVDPRDADHLYLGISGGGVFESTDGGRDWRPLNRDCELFFPDPKAEYGHDPHCMRLHPRNPDRLWQQNHCGIYRMDRPEGRWVRVGKNMPKAVGDIGFPMVLHPRDPDACWVIPMDGTSVWPRTSPGGKPSVYGTKDAGRTWKRLDRGLPKLGWLTVYRQAMSVDPSDPVGIYFGTSSGEVWGSREEGRTWKCLASHLPAIQSVEVL